MPRVRNGGEDPRQRSGIISSNQRGTSAKTDPGPWEPRKGPAPEPVPKGGWFRLDG